MSHNHTYRQLVLRLPDDLKETMRNRVAADAGMEGVDFIPLKKNSRKFMFTMDGKSYPARLVDLPCVVETHKTLDRATFFKSGDVGQMLVVYKDDAAYKRDEGNASIGPQGFHVDGLTPPMKNVVRRRFLKARPDQGKFDRAEVIKVESQVLKMQQDPPDPTDKGNNNSNNNKKSDGSGGGGGSSSRRSGGDWGKSGSGANGDPDRVVFEHDEIVPFEPWMASPVAAAVGRLEGITIKVTGATDRPDGGEGGHGDRAGAGEGAAADAPAEGALPRLFGHELLYEHPEVLLSVKDVPEDPTLRPPPPPPPKPTTPPVVVAKPTVKPVVLSKKKKQEQQKKAAETAAAQAAATSLATAAAEGAVAIAVAQGVVSTAAAAAIGAAAGTAAASAAATGTAPPAAVPTGTAAAAAGAGAGAVVAPPGDDDEMASALLSAMVEEADLYDAVPLDIFSGLGGGDGGDGSWTDNI